MEGLVTKRNAAMFLAVVMMIASAMKMVNAHESESIELTIRSSGSFKEQVSQTLMPCCENAESLACYKMCRMAPWACAKRCSCVLVTELTPNCYRGVNEIPELQHGIDGEPKLSTQMFLKEQVSQKLRACCENSQRWNCYRVCRLGVGSQQQCANYCSCVLLTELTPNCYRGVNEIPELQHGIDGEPKLSTQMFLKEQGSKKLRACCQNAQRWNCYRACRLTGSQQVCANLCSCVLVTQLTPNCYRGVNEIPELQHGIDGEPKLSTQMFLKEQVSKTLMPCCENAESLACYSRCRMVPWGCARKCLCVLVTELTPNCYQGVNEIPERQHGIDGELKLSAQD